MGFGQRFRWCFISGKAEENSKLRGIPPSPHPYERLDWRGVCKNALQNLEPLGVRGQNLENKGVAAVFAMTTCTASALIIFYSLACGWQGQMSQGKSVGVVDFSKAQ
jgi:hypothetical protein